jgi:hypothetical protein
MNGMCSQILPLVQVQLKVPSVEIFLNCDLRCLEPQRIDCGECSSFHHRTLPNVHTPSHNICDPTIGCHVDVYFDLFD